MRGGPALVELFLDLGDHWREMKRAQRMNSWREYPAEIVASEVRFSPESIPGRNGHRFDGWAANIICRYHVGGERETAVRPVVDQPPIFAERAEAERVAGGFRVGDKRSVWVNPADPHDAVFSKLDASASVGKIITTAILAAIGLAALFWYVAWPFFR